MWERFSTSGLAGAYVDELLAEGRNAQMDFRPRRAFDPYPFVVSVIAQEAEEETLPPDVQSLGDYRKDAWPGS